ncbi:hypothetical protein EJ06DRAFT_531730 [Trichodelitschia bisporula]|uniref:Uncharacterized protein n=1 Tax=Trichodelitschia bisporula TaxID=703511 RepID=A0A6G1HS15_9PEZI|nr:hypothetical protein EJ06DRAFT_531730 [Trichodelitschia bisporula]
MPRGMWLCLLQSRRPLRARQLTVSFLAFCPAVELSSKPQSLAFNLLVPLLHFHKSAIS